MAATGFFLSVPVYGSVDPIITHLDQARSLDDAREDADDKGRVSFMLAGYETMETVYATLYQIAPNGGLAHSECFPISGPETE